MDTSVIGEKDNDPTKGIEVVSQALTSKDSVLEQRYSLWSTLPGCIAQPVLTLGLDLLTGVCSDSNSENLFSKGTNQFCSFRVGRYSVCALEGATYLL